jgi:hypothetical protein
MYPSSYEVLKNGTSILDGPWNSTSESITVELEGLSAGYYNYTIIVFDEIGQYSTDTVFVEVYVDINPPIVNSPSDIEFYEGDTGYNITWDPEDIYPKTYKVLRNGTTIIDGLWNSTSEVIIVPLDGLSIGVYNYTLLVLDAENNSITDTVWVFVLPELTTITTSPTRTTSTSLSPTTSPTTETTTTTGTITTQLFDRLTMIITLGSVLVIVVVIVLIIRSRKA